MSVLFRSLTAVAALSICTLPAFAQDKELTDNPMYKFWSKSKVGSTVTFTETTKVTPPAGGGDAGEEVKSITQKLLTLTADKAVVETVVTEGEIFGSVESAPTKHIYPAKMSKEVLDELIKETGAKGEEKMVKVGDKELKVMYLTGTMKKGDEEVMFQIWLSDEVPGMIAKRIRTTKNKDTVVAVTTIEVTSFSK